MCLPSGKYHTDSDYAMTNTGISSGDLMQSFLYKDQKCLHEKNIKYHLNVSNKREQYCLRPRLSHENRKLN